MTYDLYFHNDFDGHASAAVMLSFLKSRGDRVAHFVPVDYHLQDEWLREDFFSAHKLFRGKRYPAVVLDFAYHPKAAMWFDHHPTGIKRADWRKRFMPDSLHVLAPHYFSCCHEVYDVLRKNFGWKPPRHFAALAQWLDVVDAARYASARQTIALKEPALQVDAFIEREGGSAAGSARIVKALAAKSLPAIARLPRVRKTVAVQKAEIRNALAFYRAHMAFDGRVASIDLTKAKVLRLRFAPYYLEPRTAYAVRMTMSGENVFHVNVGENPWRHRNRLDIGAIVKKYGGGGHKTVGGMEFRTRADAEQATKEVIAILNKKG